MVMADMDGLIFEPIQRWDGSSDAMPTIFPGQSVDSFTHPDDREISQSERLVCSAGSSDSYQMEKRYLHADGHGSGSRSACPACATSRTGRSI